MTAEESEFLDQFLLTAIVDGEAGTLFCLDSTEDFRYLIRAIRLKAKFSQVEMAKLLGVNQANISQWENGVVTPTLSTILLIQQFINTPILIGKPRV